MARAGADPARQGDRRGRRDGRRGGPGRDRARRRVRGAAPALVIGLVGGLVCFAAVELKGRLGYDDSLDAVGVHMVGGLVGALSSPACSPASS